MIDSRRQFDVVYVAADHAGFEHKEAVKTWLVSEKILVHDMGAYHYDGEDDFPAFMKKAARAVGSSAPHACAVIFGGSGQGEAMAANRVRNVRATVFYGGDESIISLSREHNDANILSIGARFVSVDDTKRVVWNWLHTASLPDEKYHRRNTALET